MLTSANAHCRIQLLEEPPTSLSACSQHSSDAVTVYTSLKSDAGREDFASCF